jgi:hypothetical protein
MNRSLQTIAAAILFACYALPVRAEAPPKFADRSQRCFTIGQALSLSGRAACSAGTVARSLR